MTFQEISDKIAGLVPDKESLVFDDKIIQPCLTIPAKYLKQVCQYLFQTEGLYFDFLSNLTSVDNGPVKNTLEVIYHLYSIPYNHHYILKVMLPRTSDESNTGAFFNYKETLLPIIPTVSDIWKTAEWHEREAFDLMGIWFEGHPDMRRILLPEDWKGHPLRKDYNNLEEYHGIKVAY